MHRPSSYFTIWISSAFMFCVNSGVIISDKCVTVRWSPPLKDRKLITKPFSSAITENIYGCLSKCFVTSGCLSVNFSPRVENHHVCHLLDTDSHYLHLNLSVVTGWTYLKKVSKCDTSPCPPNTTCVPDYNKNQRTCLDIIDTASITACQKILNSGGTVSRVYQVSLTNQSFYCDQTTDGGGWLVIQRNVLRNGFSFYKSWKQFQNGFGDLDGNFWWGNEKIHKMTWQSEIELRVDLKRNGGTSGYAKYTGFKLSGEDDGYRLFLKTSSYVGNIGDAMFHSGNAGYQSVGKKFTTKDKEHDSCPTCNCATVRKGGWWYDWCSFADLNSNYNGIRWMTWSGTIIQAEMKIRQV